MTSQEPEMSSETIGGRCLRTKARRHYNEGEHQDDEIEGRRTFTLEDKMDEERYTSDLVRHMDGCDLTFKFFQEHGFETPMVFRKPDGLGLKMPEAEEFTVNDVRQHVGARRVVDCMDVTTQKAETMTMATFAKYFQSEERERLLNVISLEFSHTRLDDLVHPPAVVKQIDWVDTVWPRHLKRTQTETTNIIADMKYPKVQKYCLMSVAGCYTDFHIDFGGTSVWYHLLHGEKIFWLIPPTKENLDMYQAWVLSGKQGEIFLGERVAECSMIRLRAGNTFMIPSGWIHAVYTPEDSLVFGGNILHSFAIDRQLKVNAMEDNTHVPLKFRYPFFWEINWYCLERYVHTLMGKSFLKPVPEDANRSRRNSEEEGNEENILPSGSKIERKDSFDSDKTIDVGLPGVKREDEDDDDKSSTFTEPRSRSSTPTKSSSSQGQNGHSTEDTSSQVDSVKDEDGGESSKVKGLLSSFEKKGLSDLVRALVTLPESKRCVPDFITDADALLQEAREMMKIHEGDDPLAALTGEPIIKAPKDHRSKSKQSSTKTPLASRPPAKGKRPPSGLRKRRTKCRKCDACNRGDCRECNFCKDMKKYGGSGKMKQSCREKRCSNPQLPGNTFCLICEGDDRDDPDNTLMECHQCNEVTHPLCLQDKGYLGDGIINEEMGNSWECPKCRGDVGIKTDDAGDAAVHRSTPPPSRQVLKRKQVFQEPPSPDSEPEPELSEYKPAPRKKSRGRPAGKVQATQKVSTTKRYSYPHRNSNDVYEGEDDDDSMDSPPVRTHYVSSVSVNGSGIADIHVDQLSDESLDNYSPYQAYKYESDEEVEVEAPEATNAMDLLNGLFDNMV